MKKLANFLIIIVFTLVLSGCLPKNNLPEASSQPTTSPAAEQESKVDVVLDFGEENIATYSGISARTALEALKKVSQAENFLFETKEYDFGILVESIDGKRNNKDKAWLYYVNGKMADKAADQYENTDGDIIEWRYEKVQF